MSNKYWDSSNVVSNIGSILLGILMFLAVVFPLMFYFVVVNGYVGMKLWAWFVVPTFGLQALTLTQAWGISFILLFWTNQLANNKVTDGETPSNDLLKQAIAPLITPWMVLFLAWMSKTFIFAIIS